MSATDELRRMLDEHGVEYATDDNNASNVTMWTTQNGGWVFDCDYMEPLNAKPGTIGAKTELMIYGYTPEQAVEATLGNEESYTRDDVESAFVSGYSLGCLPVGSDPQWDQNEQTVDEHMAELGWVRAATLGAGTCKVESTRMA